MYKAMIKKSKNKKGFTLVELIVVMAILAILAAILIPSVSGMIRRSNRAVDNSTARNLLMAGAMAAADNLDGAVKITNTDGTVTWVFTETAADDSEALATTAGFVTVIQEFIGTTPPAIKEVGTMILEVDADGDVTVKADGSEFDSYQGTFWPKASS